jgi:hypothetical protein
MHKVVAETVGSVDSALDSDDLTGLLGFSEAN